MDPPGKVQIKPKLVVVDLGCFWVNPIGLEVKCACLRMFIFFSAFYVFVFLRVFCRFSDYGCVDLFFKVMMPVSDATDDLRICVSAPFMHYLFL